MGTARPMAAPSARAPRGSAMTVLYRVMREPFSRRARREFLFCLIEGPLALSLIAVPFGLVGATAQLAPGSEVVAQRWALGVLLAESLVLVMLAPRVARILADIHRGLAAVLLGERVALPPAQHHGHGLLGWLRAGLRDGPGWRAAGYLVAKLPVAVLELYAAFFFAIAGLIDLTYPFWFRSFRNHPPSVHLSPAAALTPFGVFHVSTFAGTFVVFAGGVAMVLAAPWVATGATSVDRWLMRSLLGPGRLAQRVADLEQTRALAVEDSAALLRRLERDLHDGAQIRLAALAMNLGMAREKLGDGGAPLDVAAVRELVDAAHQGAKDALIELRNLARGIHPPVLDNGLADALATLAAGSAIPVRLTADIPVRPSPAIETIAYFCAAELLANAAKHSYANTVTLEVTQHDGVLRLCVADDGVGGADPSQGSGLPGLAGRVRSVDGRLDIASPPGGPTRITVELPLQA